jgi:hypothetical protein
MSVSYDNLFFYVESTYWKPTSTTPLLNLLVGIMTFSKVVEDPLCYLIQVRSVVLQDWCLVFTLTFWTYIPEA